MGVVEPFKRPTLEEAIERYVNLGEKDPIKIAQRVMGELGDSRTAVELMQYAEDIIAGFARQRLSSLRRSAEIALLPGDPNTTANLKVTKFWVPGKRTSEGHEPSHWVKAADLTPDDLRARASWYDDFAAGAVKRAIWCRQVADMIEAENVDTLGQLKGTLPPLPDDDELKELL